jgi:REP element-mobilizing transposase RayT
MPRRTIRFAPGLYYHIYNRGNNRQSIFFQPDNYIFFLRNIHRYLLSTIDMIAYCLMPTHYHLLVRIKESENETSRFSAAMMRLSVSYTKAINKRFERVGVLFQGVFKAKNIKKISHLLSLCRYIHANPVKGGLVTSPEDWPYSNYLEWIGKRQGHLVDKGFIHDHFDTPEQYEEFVLDYLQARAASDRKISEVCQTPEI